MPDIRPDRDNWRQFCQEPPLTDEELALYDQLKQAVKVAGFVGSTEIQDFIFEATGDESQALRCQEEQPHADDWADVVAFADASRRLRRAEVAAWVKWKATLAGAERSE